MKLFAINVYGLWDYLGKFMCFYYDYNQIEEGYRLLRESIINYDSDDSNRSGIKTDYMFDIKDISFEREVFLMNFDNILSSIKLNCEYKYVSFNIDNYAGNINTIKNDLNKYILKKKTVILCVVISAI